MRELVDEYKDYLSDNGYKNYFDFFDDKYIHADDDDSRLVRIFCEEINLAADGFYNYFVGGFCAGMVIGVLKSKVDYSENKHHGLYEFEYEDAYDEMKKYGGGHFSGIGSKFLKFDNNFPTYHCIQIAVNEKIVKNEFGHYSLHKDFVDCVQKYKEKHAKRGV